MLAYKIPLVLNRMMLSTSQRYAPPSTLYCYHNICVLCSGQVNIKKSLSMEKGLSGGKNSALSTWLILEKSEVGASVKTQTPGFIN